MWRLIQRKRWLAAPAVGPDVPLSAGQVLAHGRRAGPQGWRIELDVAGEDRFALALKTPQGQLHEQVVLPTIPAPWTLKLLRSMPLYDVLLDRLVEQLRAGREAFAASPATAPGASRRLAYVSVGLSVLALGISVAAAAASFYGMSVSLAARVTPPIVSAGGDMLGAFAGIRLSEDRLGPTGLAVLQDVAARSGFSLNPEGQAVVMFADPLCPACKQFEQWIAEDGYATFAPLIVPVAFQPGAMEAAAAVLCARGREAEVWRQAVAGAALQPCEDGRRQVEINNAAFETLGLSGTPAFVALDGQLLIGARSPAEMARWALAHTPADVLSSAATAAPVAEGAKP